VELLSSSRVPASDRGIVSEIPAYQPASRRPIAEMFRRTAQGATALCLRLGISADAISYFSIAAAAGAAFCLARSAQYPLLLIVAPLLCFLRLWCNMLDGMVALAAGTASRRGEVLNDLPDRISDVVIFVGAAQSGWMHPLIGYWAAMLSLGTAYIGTLGQAVGGRREFGGIMSKPWRMLVLGLGAWLTYALVRWNGSNLLLARLSMLDWSCLAVIAGCLQTSAQRLRQILRSLK
jgi:phosphatidylglycerophosphate synthase